MQNYTGKRLDGRYEIHEVIGVGGMAVVYKAYDNINDRIVSVKILKEEYLANAEFRRRFKNESKAIAVLSHPNIVKVFDVSYGDKLQYIVMEYVEGITLKEYIEQQGRLDVRETVHFMMQILRALQHAHDKGVVHRDIKPQNILLLSNGNIKVTDFGIARFSCSDTKTMTDSAIGSVHYISPEQARGDITDDKTDLYSAGVVLYEMLTGKVPFESESSVSVALMHLQNDAKRPREINSNIPVGLEQITMRAMQKNVKDRYQSAAEMLLDIEEFKRNPNTRFSDSYFTDKNPTRSIPSAQIRSKAVSMPSINGAPAPVVSQPVAKQPEPVEEQETSNSKTPVIIGVVSGLLVVLLIVFGVLFFKFFANSRLTVPNLVGKNYAEEIAGNSDYDRFKFEVEYVQNSTHEDGHVFNQEPRAGQKIDKNSNTIIISVASTIQMVPVPDVTGYNYTEAKKMLTSKGFSVTATPQTSSTQEFGTVITTYPEPNTEVQEGTTVVIYYASDESLISVPELIGWDLETAEQLLISLNLELDDADIKSENSDAPEGEVIGQSLDPGTKVESGTKVGVTVSNGIPEASTASISVQLPSYSTGTTGKVMATLNNDVLFEKNLLLDGSVYSFSVEGAGEDNTLKVFVDSTLLYTCQIDFTKTPASISDAQYNNVSAAKATLPSVVGFTLSRAKLDLLTQGFNNIEVKEVAVSNSIQNGIVLDQSPDASSSSLFAASYPLDTKITLTVGTYEGV